METKAFVKNEEQIKEREKIVPFGRAVDYFVEKPVPISFKLYSTEIENMASDDAKSSIYKAASSIYVAPSIINKTYRLKEVSVRITNIPAFVTQKDLFELLEKKCPGLFFRSNLIFDKETKASKGYAYASCESLEKAREFAKAVRQIEIDGFALASEVLFE